MHTHPKLNDTREELLRLQRRIYGSLKREVERLLGPPPPAIQTYERAFRGEFKTALRSGRARAISKKQLLDEIDPAQVIFVGDYHTDPQAQKTALRLLRELHARHPNDAWYLAIEMIPSQHQRSLEAYLAGRMSLEKFHHAIRYREEWGFPWAHYAPLFEYARANGIAVVGLNRPRALALPRGRSSARYPDDLRARDQWAAGVLTDRLWEARQSGKRARALVLYGEMHLASRHLPAAFKEVSRAFFSKRTEQTQTATIFLNQDDLYFRYGKSEGDGILKLAERRYCLLTGTPWGKLQSVINWVEGGAGGPAVSATPEDGADGELWEHSAPTDELTRIASHVQWLADFLKRQAPSMDRLQAISIHDADRLLSILQDPSTTIRLERAERALLRTHWLRNQRVFVPSLQLAYVGSPSANAAAEMAALFLQAQATGQTRLLPPGRDGWYELTLRSAFGFLGSLLANPKRKCDFARDHRRRLAELRKGAEASFTEELRARTLTIAALQSSSGARAPLAYASGSTAERNAAVLCARWSGKVMAKLLYPRLIAGEVSLAQIKKWFLARPPAKADTFEIRYAEIAALTLQARSLRAHQRSKSDQF